MEKSGFVAILGRPNVGKSTLMNTILGQKLSIVTHKAQTTRNKILGIHTVREKGQLVFIDTPGIHRSKKALNQAMNAAAASAIGVTDLYLFLVEATSIVQDPSRPIWGGDLPIANILAPHEAQTILVINKVDLLPDKTLLFPALEELGKTHNYLDIIPLSAKKRSSVKLLVKLLFEQIPEGHLLYPEDMISDRAERFFAAEMVREQILLQTQNEVPYSVAVIIETFSQNSATGKLEIRAVIHVERDSQKGIMIGKGGFRLKKIGIAARKELQTFFEKPVHLTTFVRVSSKWTERTKMLSEFGYNKN